MQWRIGALTFNVNNRQCNANSVEILLSEVLKHNEENVDVVVVSLQEVAASERADLAPITWKESLHEQLWNRGFYCASSSYMVTNFLAVFVKIEFLHLIEQCSYEYIKDLYYGAKGSICMTLTLKGNVNFVFIGSHFVHDAKQNNRRISQAKSVKDFVTKSWSSKPIVGVLWLGDLNFRVVNIDVDTVIRLLNSGDSETLKQLKNSDQLSEARFYYDVFEDWEEAEINFNPTYKFMVIGCKYDKNRTPSWTDRILYRNLTNTYYNVIKDVKISDHLPVMALLNTPNFDMTSTYSWLVSFEEISSWYVNLPLRVTFSGSAFWKNFGSIWDWIGLYKTPNVSERRFVQSANIMTCIDNGTSYVVEFSALPVGRYFVAYHSYNKGCVQGMSTVFNVK